MSRVNFSLITQMSDFPKIYGFIDKRYPTHIKVGYTTRKDVWDRIKESYPLKTVEDIEESIELVFEKPAMREDGSSFFDHDVHKMLNKMGYSKDNKSEFFKIGVRTLESAYMNVFEKKELFDRHLNFKLRDEQKRAIEVTKSFFNSHPQNNKFLWNAKMRFGKTFTTYELCKEMKMSKILIVTFKPSVSDSWENDLNSHISFENWKFNKNEKSFSPEQLDSKMTNVFFISFQDLLGKNSKTETIKEKNRWIFKHNWDIVVFDEYHFGSWRDNAKDLFENKEEFEFDDVIEEFDTNEIKERISSKYFLYLSGTPFRAIANGEFIEEQIFNWTYIDEQKRKFEWVGNDNPYLTLPSMVMMTYKVPNNISSVIEKFSGYDEFSLNEFFKTENKNNKIRFVYEDHVSKWLNMLCRLNVNDFVGRSRKDLPPMPFENKPLSTYLNHTFWYLPNVNACRAMSELLRDNNFYHSYEIIVAAGKEAGNGVKALEPVRRVMQKSQSTKSITLSCGKLTTGVTIPQWTGIFMLRDLSSPESYFQSIFRVQSPWVTKNDKGSQVILKDKCYVFDFAPNRTLSLIVGYASNLCKTKDEYEKKKNIAELIEFMPVLAADGDGMKEIDASELLDMAINGQTATLLAKKWNSTLLVNVDNETLNSILKSPDALLVIEKIEGFRNIKDDIKKIITLSDKIKDIKKQNDMRELSKTEKTELSKDEKERISLRKKIQEKLIKFATRIPVFMYLTDYREESLEDIIMKLEPMLFKKVTGLEISDFELLTKFNVFNKPQMNDAIFKFKRYEDNSLNYLGNNEQLIKKKVGGFDTTIARVYFDEVY